MRETSAGLNAAWVHALTQIRAAIAQQLGFEVNNRKLVGFLNDYTHVVKLQEDQKISSRGNKQLVGTHTPVLTTKTI